MRFKIFIFGGCNPNTSHLNGLPRYRELVSCSNCTDYQAAVHPVPAVRDNRRMCRQTTHVLVRHARCKRSLASDRRIRDGLKGVQGVLGKAICEDFCKVLGDKRSMYEGTVLVFFHWELIIVDLINFFPFVLICSYHVPFFSVKKSQGFATCSTALFVQQPGSQGKPVQLGCLSLENPIVTGESYVLRGRELSRRGWRSGAATVLVNQRSLRSSGKQRCDVVSTKNLEMHS